jgi:hypothetical protein
MAAFRVLFDVPSYKRQLECGPPIKKTRWIIHLLSFGAEIQWRTLNSSPFELRLSDFDFEKMYGFVRQFSSKWRANCWIPIKIYRWSLIGVVFKVRSHKWLQFDQFLLDFNDSRVILTRIVSQIRTTFRNRNRTIVARTATIIVWIIEVYTVTFSVGGGKVLLQRLSTGGPRSDRT